MTPKPGEIRAKIPAEACEQSTARAILIFVPPVVFYSTSLVAIAIAPRVYIKLILAVVNSLFIAILFVVGHDSCHGSFTSKRWLNALLGRLAFLPSLHPFSSWELGHNRLHHCWTNLRGRDYVWTPLSYEDYCSLSPARRFRERFYRSPYGVGAYYFVEIWWKHMIYPRSTDIAKLPKMQSVLDRISVVLFVLFLITVLAFVAEKENTGVVATIVSGFVIPQIIWNWLMGFVVFQHHTHPRVVWFDNQQDWTFFAGQVQGTVEVIFPWPIGFILHNIMDHTAHHVDPKIPLYNLPSSQRAVREAYAEHVIQSRFTPRTLLRIMAACRLYDYRSRQWLDFNGMPTQSQSS